MMTLSALPSASREVFASDLALWSAVCAAWSDNAALRVEFRGDFPAFAAYRANERALRERAAALKLKHYSRRERAGFQPV